MSADPSHFPHAPGDDWLRSQLAAFGVTLEAESGLGLRSPHAGELASVAPEPGVPVLRRSPDGRRRRSVWLLAAAVIVVALAADGLFVLNARDTPLGPVGNDNIISENPDDVENTQPPITTPAPVDVPARLLATDGSLLATVSYRGTSLTDDIDAEIDRLGAPRQGETQMNRRSWC